MRIVGQGEREESLMLALFKKTLHGTELVVGVCPNGFHVMITEPFFSNENGPNPLGFVLTGRNNWNRQINNLIKSGEEAILKDESSDGSHTTAFLPEEEGNDDSRVLNVYFRYAPRIDESRYPNVYFYIQAADQLVSIMLRKIEVARILEILRGYFADILS